MNKNKLPVTKIDEQSFLKLLSEEIASPSSMKPLFSFEELIENYESSINVKVLDNINELVKECSYRKFLSSYINDLTKELIIEEISDDDYKIIKKTLDNLFREELRVYFLQIEVKLLKMKKTSKNLKEYEKRLIEFMKDDTKNYIEYLIKDDEIKYNNQYLILIKKYEYYPIEIRSIFNKIKINDTLTIGNYISYCKKMLIKFNEIKSIDNLLHKTVEDKKDKIINMRNYNMSFSKIQEILTAECIEEGLIPKTIERYDRKANSKNNIIRTPCLLPISSIKKILNEELKTNQIANNPYKTIEIRIAN